MHDKVFAVTGGFGSIGRAVAEHLVERGAKVALIDVGEAPDGLPSGALSLGGVDLTDSTQAEGAIGTVVDRLGGLDGLANIAGTFRFETLAEGQVDTWDLLYRINLRTAVNGCRAALGPLRNRRGAIVNVGAANAVVPAGAGLGAYAASKAGVVKLTESLAAELKDAGVRVNAVLPGIVDTAPNRRAMPDADVDRWVKTDALADAIGFLLSPASRAVTGATLAVTGRL